MDNYNQLMFVWFNDYNLLDEKPSVYCKFEANQDYKYYYVYPELDIDENRCFVFSYDLLKVIGDSFSVYDDKLIVNEFKFQLIEDNNEKEYFIYELINVV